MEYEILSSKSKLGEGEISYKIKIAKTNKKKD
jgi:hypothetical protein